MAGRSFDVGLMQVNNWWLNRFGIPLEAAFDPEANIYLGVWILKNEIDRHPNIKSAVGAYHSPDPSRANRYVNTVMAALEKGPQAVPKSKRTAQKSSSNSDAPSTSSRQLKPPKIDSGPMMVISRSSFLVNPQNMNVALSNGHLSMKAGLRNE